MKKEQHSVAIIQMIGLANDTFDLTKVPESEELSRSAYEEMRTVTQGFKNISRASVASMLGNGELDVKEKMKDCIAQTRKAWLEAIQVSLVADTLNKGYQKTGDSNDSKDERSAQN